MDWPNLNLNSIYLRSPFTLNKAFYLILIIFFHSLFALSFSYQTFWEIYQFTCRSLHNSQTSSSLSGCHIELISVDQYQILFSFNEYWDSLDLKIVFRFMELKLLDNIFFFDDHKMDYYFIIRLFAIFFISVRLFYH